MSSRTTKIQSKGSSRRRLVFEKDEDESSNGSTNASRENQTPTKTSPPSRKHKVTTPASPPRSKRFKTVAAVTPEEQLKLSTYVPTYIHKNVEYLRKAEAKLSPETLRVYKWICARYVVPIDFEQKRSYGPLSGTNYEERVVQAYALGTLERSETAPDAETKICTVCAAEGHSRDDCPTLI